MYTVISNKESIAKASIHTVENQNTKTKEKKASREVVHSVKESTERCNHKMAAAGYREVVGG